MTGSSNAQLSCICRMERGFDRTPMPFGAAWVYAPALEKWHNIGVARV
jgi:hypothetical protein